MDVEELITAIYEKTPIWDKHHKLHSNKNAINLFWKKISSEMNEDENKLRKKWKYLRDQFAIELRKISLQPADTSESPPTSKWVHFNQLMFLKDIVSTSKRLRKNEVQVQKTETLSDTNETEESLEEFDPLPIKRQREGVEMVNEMLVDFERRNTQYSEPELVRVGGEEDDHLLFFKSLLPHVRKIPQSRQLSFRNRVQDLVEQFAYPSNFPSCFATSISYNASPSPDPETDR